MLRLSSLNCFPLPEKVNRAPFFRLIPSTFYTRGLGNIEVNRRITDSTISLMSRRICWVSVSVETSRLRIVSISLMISVILTNTERGLSIKWSIRLIILVSAGIPWLRSLLTVVVTKSINSSTDFVSLQRCGPSGVASISGSQAAKHVAVIWREYGIQT